MKIRRVDTYFGMLFITVAGALAVFFILHVIDNIPSAFLANYSLVPGV